MRQPPVAIRPLAFPALLRVLLQVLLVLPALALAEHQGDDVDYEDDGEHHGDQQQQHKDVSAYNGHSLVLDLSSLSVLAALKIKFLVVLAVVAAVYLLLTKGYKTQCLFGNCRPNYSTYGYYPYVDYTYVGYEVPASYRRPSQSQPLGVPTPVVGLGKDSHHLSDLTARVWNSIDIAGMAFSALNVQEDDCRRKLVCQADRAAASNPILRAALSWFSPSLARYRTDRSRVGVGAEDGEGVEWRQEDPCEEMYPLCLHRDLPPVLGGPEQPHVYVEAAADADLGTLHQHRHRHPHLHHHLLQQPETEAWHPAGADYRQEYPYVYSAIREESVGSSSPSRTPSVSSLHSQSLASDSPAASISLREHPGQLGVILGGDAVISSSSSSSTVLAPVHEESEPPVAAASTPSLGVAERPEQRARAATPRMASLDASRRLDNHRPPEPRSPESSTSPAPAQDPHGDRAPQVWRRVRFGTSKSYNRSKVHDD